MLHRSHRTPAGAGAASDALTAVESSGDFFERRKNRRGTVAHVPSPQLLIVEDDRSLSGMLDDRCGGTHIVVNHGKVDITVTKQKFITDQILFNIQDRLARKKKICRVDMQILCVHCQSG